jgi:hypothetical protein
MSPVGPVTATVSFEDGRRGALELESPAVTPRVYVAASA